MVSDLSNSPTFFLSSALGVNRGVSEASPFATRPVKMTGVDGDGAADVGGAVDGEVIEGVVGTESDFAFVLTLGFELEIRAEFISLLLLTTIPVEGEFTAVVVMVVGMTIGSTRF